MTTETGVQVLGGTACRTRYCARCGPGRSTSSRLLPSAEKRARDVGKKFDRLASRQIWYTFMAGQAYAVATGKAPSKRNAEVMVVETGHALGGREVLRFAPDRLEEFDELIADALRLWRARIPTWRFRPETETKPVSSFPTTN